MSEKIYISEQLNFWQLLSKVKGIEIPIIQRDYAQGRKNQAKIREVFLKSLRSAFDGENIELDFVYGSIEKGIFKPLDGQQRLTTLFLIHWYVVNKEKIVSDDIINCLKKFSYQTRISSRDFCKSLVTNKINFSNLVESDNDKNNSLSKTIKNSTSFFIAWQKDPTISAMLTMLDDIHYYFNKCENIWNKLVDSTNRILTFEFINLENFGLSDDLYIKMNARGKSLTSFENFKASFVKKIESEKWEANKKEIIDTFSHKADTEWTDLFWNSENVKGFDKSYIKYIAYSLIISIALEKDKKKEELIKSIFNTPDIVSADIFKEKSYNFLFNSLSAYYKLHKNKDEKYLTYDFTFWQYIDIQSENLLSIINNSNKLTYPQLVLFFAQTGYLLKNASINKTNLNNWMRVARNITHNSTIDSPESFVGAINLISELLNGISDLGIYQFLSSGKIKSKFASQQIEEEVLKGKIIINDINNAQIIHDLEDTFFCQGKIGFVLYCIDYKNEDSFNKKKIIDLTKVIQEHLSEDDFSNKFRSALLTINDNQFYNYWWSKLYVVNAPKRCLVGSTYELKNLAYNDYFKSYLKVLLNSLTNKNIDNIINEFNPASDMPNWKIRLIKEPELLDYSQSHYIAIKEDNSCCYLIPQSRVANSQKGKERLKKIK